MTFTANDVALLETAVANSFGSPRLIAPFLVPGANAFFVRSSLASGMDSSLQNKLQPSVKATLSKCRSGQNDVIFVLPGHTETVDSAWGADLVAGTRIVGLGDSYNTNAPTFTFNATGSTVSVEVADVTFANLAFTTSVNNVAVGFAVDADGFTFAGNRCTVARAGPLDFVIFIDIGMEGDYARVVGNKVLGITGVGSVITIGAGTDVRVIGNHISAAPTAVDTAGLVNIDGSAQRLLIADNDFDANLANSTCCVSVGDGASPTGTLRGNTYRIRGTASATVGFVDNSGAGSPILNHFNNLVADPNLSGILTPAAT